MPISKLWSNQQKLIAFSPILLFFSFFVFLALPFTRGFAHSMLRDNRPVELLTFLFLIAGAYVGVVLVKYIIQSKARKITSLFFSLFAFCFFFVGMEEIAWGQWFFKFNTPEVWKEMNGPSKEVRIMLKSRKAS